MQGEVNAAYEREPITTKNGLHNGHLDLKPPKDGVLPSNNGEKDSGAPERQTWGNGLEFLMSCIAMSVGLGNIWRFPFTALENGGGAFLIPYLIVLVLIGKPLYYVEMVIGQFSSRGSVKVYEMSPLMRGIGYGQLVAVSALATYYVSIMASTLIYMIGSFFDPLPWAYCRPEWDKCINSSSDGTSLPKNTTGYQTSSELYFMKEVLRETDSIDDGIGIPDWKLALGLIFSWCCIFLLLIKGVKSSGKAAYFLALFPYVVMLILLVRAVTLEGASTGILFFITPQWEQLLNPNVWYAAVTQMFFSISVCFGNIIMYSSYNDFRHNIHRDALIVTSLDTLTSLLAGCTIFGILGHLAHQLGTDDVASVVRGGTGLAFVSYPDAIAKFTFIPQFFSFLFFFMLFVLGIGSNVAMASCIITVIRDQFPKLLHWHVTLAVALVGCSIGLVYITPGGQFILQLVDYFGASFVVFILAIAEIITISWIYGIDNLCRDMKFMLGPKLGHVGPYWRICWAVVTPVLLGVILIYTLVTMQPLKYNGALYPNSAYAAGWCLAAFGILQLVFWAAWSIYKQKQHGFLQRLWSALEPSSKWGPANPQLKAEWIEFKKKEIENENKRKEEDGLLKRIKSALLGHS